MVGAGGFDLLHKGTAKKGHRAAKPGEFRSLRARLINPALKQQPLLSRDREGAVPFARFSRILQVPLQLVQTTLAVKSAKLVESKLQAAMPGPSAKIEAPVTPAVHSGRRLWVSLAVLLIGTVVLIWAGAWWRARVASAQIRSLAVLPFSSDLTQRNEDWLAASFAGEIIDRLACAPGMHVVGRTSAVKIRSDAVKQLGVSQSSF